MDWIRVFLLTNRSLFQYNWLVNASPSVRPRAFPYVSRGVFLPAILSALCLLPAVAAGADAAEKPEEGGASSAFHWNLEPFTGLFWGEVSEYVFSSTSGARSDSAPAGYRVLSRLDWRFSPVWLAGVRNTFEIKSLRLYASFVAGVPLGCGDMRDYDWGASGALTDYSKHDNSLEYCFAFSTGAGWRFSFLDGRLAFTPSLGVQFSSTAFRAEDGYTQYASEDGVWTDGIPKESVSGKVVSYNLRTFSLALGAEVSWRFSRVCAVGLDLGLQPVVFAFGYDTHHKRGLKFLDYAMGGVGAFAFSCGLTGEINVSDSCAFLLRTEGALLSTVSGKSYYAADGDSYTASDDKGGASAWTAGFSAGVRFRVF